MKKILLVITVLTTTLLLSGCGNNSDSIVGTYTSDKKGEDYEIKVYENNRCNHWGYDECSYDILDDTISFSLKSKSIVNGKESSNTIDCKIENKTLNCGYSYGTYSK